MSKNETGKNETGKIEKSPRVLRDHELDTVSGGFSWEVGRVGYKAGPILGWEF